MQLEPIDFLPECTTVWSFLKRGSWATHNGHYRGNWSPYVPRNLLLRYSSEGDTVLDPFVGGGTTLIEAKLLHRNCIGLDINPQALTLCQKVTDFTCQNPGHIQIRLCDARYMNCIDQGSIDLICTHPPYANAIHYSKSIPTDLSNFSYSDFLSAMRVVASQCFRVLKEEKYCAVMMGDLRKNGNVVPLGFRIMNIFESVGFTTHEIILKEQHNCASTHYWSIRSNNAFLLLAHEYIFVFKK